VAAEDIPEEHAAACKALCYKNRLGPLLVTFQDGRTLRVPQGRLSWYDEDKPPGFMSPVPSRTLPGKSDYRMTYVDPAEVASVAFDPAPDPDILALSEGRVPDWMLEKMRRYPDLYTYLFRTDPGYLPVLIDRARESDACPLLPGDDAVAEAAADEGEDEDGE
jgi:hypothetical protein